MQVKRRINQFFGNILRKDKLQAEDEEEPSYHGKNKQKEKSNQSYSQWDLVENIAGEPIEDPILQGSSSPPQENKMIFSDGLAKYIEGTSDENFIDLDNDNMNDAFGKKRKSFLKRSGSLLRRSLRRSKRKARIEKENDGDYQIPTGKSEVLTDVVEDINKTLLAVAAFGDDFSKLEENNKTGQKIYPDREILFENCATIIHSADVHNACVENDISFNQRKQIEEVWNQNEKKVGLGNGLKRQASRLASKFQRSPGGGSVRLKSTASVESFPNTHKNKSASFSINPMIASPSLSPSPNSDLLRTSSFKRKLSFKQAKKVMTKGAASFGKSMMHASAVMPIAYESPPVTFYPDYDEDEYPSHLAQAYYKTISYQPKDGNNWNDKIGERQQNGHYARPTSFYQHGYCYNG